MPLMEKRKDLKNITKQETTQKYVLAMKNERFPASVEQS